LVLAALDIAGLARDKRTLAVRDCEILKRVHDIHALFLGRALKPIQALS
jgi:hypothetical protein